MHSRFTKRPQTAALLASTLLVATFAVSGLAKGLLNIDGSYEDNEGSKIKISTSKGKITLLPQMGEDEMPAEIRAVLGEIRLEGPLKVESDTKFSLDTRFKKVVQPEAGVKLDLDLSLKSKGEKLSTGLQMSNCTAVAKMKVIVDGAEADNKTESHDCSGLWKKLN